MDIVVHCEDTWILLKGTSIIFVVFFIGLPPALNSVNATVDNSDITIAWTVDPAPNITFCVEVVNSTSYVSQHSECNRTDTEISYSLPEEYWCVSYTITVTPVNLIGRGKVYVTSAEIMTGT